MKDVIKYLSEWGLNIHFASIYPPTLTQAATVIEEEEEAAGCSSQQRLLCVLSSW